MYNRSNSINSFAIAKIYGSKEYPQINGTVKFKQLDKGVLVTAEIYNLPYEICKKEIYGFHIHQNGNCTGNNEDEFLNAGSHYSKNDCEHPYHSGDMPPLFGNKGYAYLSFFTDRFSIKEIIGRSVIIHLNTDDLITPPAGKSGKKIACGVIN